jgi:NAD(P)-dependent dehydrogenase (short-subunit alcohol dehydrogenase family)
MTAARTVWVTGAASGMGESHARRFAELGDRVVCWDRDDDALQGVVGSIREAGGAAEAVCVDITDWPAVERGAAMARDALGPAQVVIANAGILSSADHIADVDPDEWRRVVDVNLTGTFLSCQAFARVVLTSGGSGSIVNVSSMSAFVVNVPQHQAAYNASKAGVDQLTRSLAVEWVERGIRVNAVAPGYFLSDMTRQFIDADPETGAGWRARVPAGRLGEPGDLRGLVVFLASDASRYVVGESVVIDGGYTLV